MSRATLRRHLELARRRSREILRARAPAVARRGEGSARRVLDEAGQSTLEFALTLLLLMGFTLFYVQLTLVFAFGNYVHYATFMSARAFLSASLDSSEQVERARDVITTSLKRRNAPGIDRYPAIAKGVDGDGDLPGLSVGSHSQYDEKARDLSWLQGVRYSFRSRLFMIPLGGPADRLDPNVNSVTLTAESWLGKEPSYSECAADMRRFGGSAAGGRLVLYDNGC